MNMSGWPQTTLNHKDFVVWDKELRIILGGNIKEQNTETHPSSYFSIYRFQKPP